MVVFRTAVWLLWPAVVLGFSSSSVHAETSTALLEKMASDNKMACTSVRKIDEYLASQRLNLGAGQAKPLVELFNALSVYQALECDFPGSELGASAFPVIVQEELLRVKEEANVHTFGGREQDPVINSETVEQMQEVATAAPPEFQSAVFQCVSDYERCSTYYVAKGQGFDAGLGCGMTFMVCVAAKLIPLAGK